MARKRERKPKTERVRRQKQTSEKSSGNDYDKLFDFIKVFFGSNPKYKEVSDYQKKKHKFILNRFMSIRYPDTAQRFNINKINPVAVVNLWRVVAGKYNRTPSWIFTKTKKSPERKENDFIPSEDTINFYLRFHKISKRDLNDAMKFHKNDILNELERIEKTRSTDE
jgi:hypothetical protein